MPEDAFTKSFGSATRTVADIVYEVNLVNEHICMTLRGEEAFQWPDNGWIKAPQDFQTKDVVVGAFEKSTQDIITTVDALSTEDLEATVKTERGETPRFERCQFMAIHIWYHSGQLNYIQTLLGDSGWHW